MKDDFQFGNEFSLNHLANDAPLRRARDSSDKQSSLDESFPWHRIRRMSRK